MVKIFDPVFAYEELKTIEDPWDLLRKACELAEGRVAVGVSGHHTATAILGGACKQGIPIRAYIIDTKRLFPETYAYLEELERTFKIPIERYEPDPVEVEKMVNQHGLYLFFDSRAKQEYCCFIRKVKPNRKALETMDIWVTGLRKDQSPFRKDTKKVELVEVERPQGGKRTMVKLNPLADWTEEDVWKFMEENNFPVHPLLKRDGGDWYYESLGCIICTTPQARWEPPRAGRWRWFKENNDPKECGIHTRS